MVFKIRKQKEVTKYYPINKVTSGYIYRYGNIVTYYLKGENGYDFFSPRARESWGLRTFELNPMEDSLPNKIVGTLGFRDGSLIQNFKDGKIYVVSDAKKRLLTAPLEDYGFDWADVISVSNDEAEFHEDGTDL